MPETRAYKRFQRLAEQNEAGIGVLGARARLGFEGQFKAGAKQRGRRGGGAKELHVAGQPGVVRQQVAQLHMAGLVTGSAARHKAGQQLAQRRIQIEQAALVEQHGRSRGGHDLGEAGHVVDGLRGDGGRAFLIGKAAQCTLEHDFSACQHTEGAAGKGAGGDCTG